MECEKGCWIVKLLLGWAQRRRTRLRKHPPGGWLSSLQPADRGDGAPWLLGSQQTGSGPRVGSAFSKIVPLSAFLQMEHNSLL